jgi:23S rRNA (uracil1939-C5)-methyltransferase
MKKNDIITVDIIDNGMNLEGIAKVGNIVIFIPNCIIGENIDVRILKVDKNIAYGKMEKINLASEFRVEEICEKAISCGGCDIQHIEYHMGLRLKSNIVKNTLDKFKINYLKLNNIIGMGLPLYYRNKAQYPVRNINGVNKIGFYAKRSHNIIENNCCYIQNRVIDMLSKIIFEKLMELNFSCYNEDDNSGDIRHILIKRGYHTLETMIVIVVNSNRLLTDNRFIELIEKLDKTNIKGIFLNVNDSKTNEILGDKTKCIYGEEYITEIISNYSYYISPKSFFQVNTVQTEMLYHSLEDSLKLNENDIIFDLYSGVGSIGIFLSKFVKKVYGIEIEEEAVKMANMNISRNNITNCEYIAGSVEDKIIEFKKRNILPNVIVVDPPRKGLDNKTIEYILEFKPQKIAYVSCNIRTMCRDLKLLENEYEVISVTPVDMFPYTTHVECIVCLQQKNI